MTSRSKRPLYDALKAYAALEPARFHMPGHKGSLFGFDVTEVDGTDNLSAPTGPILKLEELCSAAFHSKEALISVGGSTAANIAMLLSLGLNKRVLLTRNCHCSVINGMALAGHTAFLLDTDGFGIVTPEAVDAALKIAPCDAVFITSPTYRGLACDVAGIAEAAHAHGALLLVDCAHGAHFAFGSRLPAVPVFADMWCVSCHKTLEALNQTALLCIGASSPHGKEKVRRALRMVQTTSPSYPLMLSIEQAIACPSDWDGHCERLDKFKDALLGISGIRLLEQGTAFESDPTRLNISAEGLTGYELADLLIKKRVYPEMSDSECVTLITAPSDREEWYFMLYDALREAALPEKGTSSFNHASMPEKAYCAHGIDIRAAVLCESESLPLDLSCGRVCAGAVGIYPPGTALLFPGEAISSEAIRIIAPSITQKAVVLVVNGKSTFMPNMPVITVSGRRMVLI